MKKLTSLVSSTNESKESSQLDDRLNQYLIAQQELEDSVRKVSNLIQLLKVEARKTKNSAIETAINNSNFDDFSFLLKEALRKTVSKDRIDFIKDIPTESAKISNIPFLFSRIKDEFVTLMQYASGVFANERSVNIITFSKQGISKRSSMNDTGPTINYQEPSNARTAAYYVKKVLTNLSDEDLTMVNKSLTYTNNIALSVNTEYDFLYITRTNK